MSYARQERSALCALLDETGPDAPTLCQGWQTVDLAAHLVLRERRPDAAVGIMGGPLARYTERLQRSLAEHTPFPHLVEEIRSGPPPISFFRIPGVDERANVTEFFVHHEDVRRAREEWEPREISAGLAEVLWQRLRMARFVLRKVPVGVELVRDDLPAEPGRHRVRITAKARAPMVTVTGSPAELTMWALGRATAARVRVDGAAEDVHRLTKARWRV